MPEIDKICIVVGEWVEKVENDLANATCILRMDRACPADTVCFHAQQCVEKYLKALLVWNQIPFGKTHDVGEIFQLLPETDRPVLTVEEARRLTAYATVTRYPGDYDPISLTEARLAVRIARRVRATVRKLLPRKALLRRR